jgi:hypothetical protein
VIRKILLVLLFAVGLIATGHAGSPAEMISSFRAKHGEGPVVVDTGLTKVARDQAVAMANKNVLDHDVLGDFSKRVAAAGASSAAENIAYGYDGFPKTLEQWIGSSGHRKNLLLPGATRVGVASAKSTNGRTYWAMAIAGGYERPKAAPAKSTQSTKSRQPPRQACSFKILQLCF